MTRRRLLQATDAVAIETAVDDLRTRNAASPEVPPRVIALADHAAIMFNRKPRPAYEKRSYLYGVWDVAKSFHPEIAPFRQQFFALAEARLAPKKLEHFKVPAHAGGGAE